MFDLDGVLVDSRAPFARSINAALIAHGLRPRDEEELHACIGPPLDATFERLAGAGAIVASCVEAFRESYAACAASETPVFDGVPALLDGLAARMPLVVATSKPQGLADRLLDDLALSRYFVAAVGPLPDEEHEPKAVTVGRALRVLPAGSRTVIVGDRSFDIAAGRAHGLMTIGVLWGIGGEAELRAAGADLLARTPAQLRRLMLEDEAV